MAHVCNCGRYASRFNPRPHVRFALANVSTFHRVSVPSAVSNAVLTLMKKLIALLTLIAALPVAAQTNGVMATNLTTVTVPEFITTIWNTTLGEGMTNLTVATSGTYTPSLHAWGWEFALIRNIPLGGGFGAGIGAGIDYYQRNFYALNLQLSLQADMRPISGFGGWATNVVVTPISLVGVGTPFGGQTGDANNVETFIAGGAVVHLLALGPGELGVGGMYGTRTGLGAASGTFYGAILSWTASF